MVTTCFVHRGRCRRGFTLLESLSAAGILLVIVIAVTSAITAGQQHALEANRRIAATLAVEELVGRLTTEDYASLPTWNGYAEAVGSMTDMDGGAMPNSFAAIGRDVQVVTELKEIGELDVRVRGRVITVRGVDADNRLLAEVSRFVPEPAS
jgi:hypothetical protein